MVSSPTINQSISGTVLMLLVLIGAISSVQAESKLDLSPQAESFELEGIRMWQLTFANGTSHKAIYQSPQGWKYSGGRDSLELQPSNIAQATATIAKLPASVPVSFDDEGRRQLRERAIASLPQGSQQTKVISEEVNPLRIDGNQTYLIEMSYVFFGQKFECYCLVLDRKPEPMSFRFSSRASDYQQYRDAFQRSLYTWQNL